jgi:hypothetical protein
MKTLLTFAAVVCLSALPAYSADGQISKSTLSHLGLAGLTSLSDAQGLEIRGLGVADAWNQGKDYGNWFDGKHKEKEHKHHEKHEHENCFKAECHPKPTCNFSSLCHTHCGKSG